MDYNYSGWTPEIKAVSDAEVFLQHQRHRAAQAGHAVLECRNQKRRTPAGKHLRLDFRFDDAAETMPRMRSGANPATIMRIPRPRYWAMVSSAFAALMSPWSARVNRSEKLRPLSGEPDSR